MELLLAMQVAAVGANGALSSGTVSLVVSGGAMLTAVGGLWRIGMWAGRFVEFKENMERERREARESAAGSVQRHEIDTLGSHIDRRFDELSAQIAEIRKAQYQRHQEPRP